MKFSYPKSNNVKFNFAPLDCSLSSEWGTQNGFAANCVNVKNGERPQIRVASNQAIFNITNYASFTDLEFTGEDQLVIDESNDGCDYGAYPVQKCSFSSAPTSIVEALKLETLTNINGCTYSCGVDGYDPVGLLNYT